MKNLFFFSFLITVTVNSYCQRNLSKTNLVVQKPSIDTNTINSWTYSPNEVSITTNGEYVCYSLCLEQEKYVVYIKATDGSWQTSFNEAQNPNFIGNDQYLIFKQGKDSIGVFQLADRQMKFINDGTHLVVPKNNADWVAWKSVNEPNKLVMWNAITNRKIVFDNIDCWQFSDMGKVLLLKKKESNKQYDLKWINLVNGQETSIWTGFGNPSNFSFDGNAQQVAFLVSDTGTNFPSIQICVIAPGLAPRYINLQTSGMKTGYHPIRENMVFSSDGNRLFFKVKSQSLITQSHKPDLVSVDVWHYNDRIIQEQQLAVIHDQPKSIQAVAHLQENNVVLFGLAENEEIKDFNSNADYLLVVRDEQLPNEKQFRPSLQGFGNDTYILVSVKNGERSTVLYRTNISRSALSPKGKFMVWVDPKTGITYSYDIAMKKKRQLTANTTILRESSARFKNDGRFNSGPLLEFFRWQRGDTVCIVYDEYDIWQFDVVDKNAPICLTKNFGRRNKIQLRLIDALNPGSFVQFKIGDTILIKGVNSENFQESFFFMTFRTDNSPVLLSTHNYQCHVIGKSGVNCLIIRQNSSNAPNWVITKNFQNFLQITDVQPQQAWNWYSSELIRWKISDDILGKGILYKPEDFDSTKKYPIIFSIYEGKGNGLYEFKIPHLTRMDIDIPWFVSRGYIVFEPDIFYQGGYPMRSALEVVTTGANFLAKEKWVDNKRMGLSGGSFGAIEINYIVANSGLFAAAAPSNSICNFVSNYGELRGWPPGSEGSQQWVYETTQMRMAATLWDRPDLYMANSAIFSANKVTTPILMQQNKADRATNWSQGIEWYMALRRLGKRVWMLQYDGEGHGLASETNKLDYTIRLEHFFNHFLKGIPAPFYMTQGIPARLKGVITGYDLDPSGNCGTKENPCKVCNMWNEKMKKDSVATMVEIREKAKSEHWMGVN